MLPSIFLKLVGVSLLVFGAYDTKVYWYALTKGEGVFDFFGRELPARHRGVKIGFSSVLVFYYVVGTVLLIFG
ncbi:MAG: hypothetical protein ABSA50_00910 [Candidatus Bathyarchaeia archaeon]